MKKNILSCQERSSVAEGQKGEGDIEMRQESSSVEEDQKRGGDVEIGLGRVAR